MEKNFIVEVWGDFTEYSTEVFYTRQEAEEYFKKIRASLNSTRFIKGSTTITDNEDENNCVILTDALKDLGE
ncbi:hypothetical protein [Piscibacillus salipiscarius]|uniref:Uncharacterized protein n=1 Tax=Piscibacillus salipiscarius TaxID=299480 RepID=A0ABW5QDX1_9BACI